jgi:hypothetical protein
VRCSDEIDSASTCGLVAHVLSDATPTPTPKRRRKYRRWLVLVAVLGGLVLWLNGPGLRFLAPRITRHFLEKSGLQGTYNLGGSFTGGLHISAVDLKGDKAIARLSIDEITPTYEWRELLKGKLKGLRIRGLHAELRLGLKSETAEKKPFDLTQLTQSIRSARGQVLPLELDFQDISLQATREGKAVLSLASSDLSHRSASADFVLQLGTLTDATGRVWAAQNSIITWNDDAILVDRLDPLPGLGLSELALQMPEKSDPSLETKIQLDGAAFTLTTSPGFRSAELLLRDGQLLVAPVLNRFGIQVPGNATVRALSLKLDDLLPNPLASTGNAQIELRDVTYREDSIPELAFDLTLEAGAGQVAARGRVLESAFTLEAAAPIKRFEKSIALGDATARFTLADVPAVLRALAPRVPALDAEASFPASTLEADFQLQISSNQLKSARTEILLQPQNVELASPIFLTGTWSSDAAPTAALVMDGLKASGSYDIAKSAYQGQLDFEGFTSTRLTPWLAITKVQVPGAANLTGKWAGSGDLKAATHTGDLTLAEAAWNRVDAPPITGGGKITYDWPKGLDVADFRVKMADQAVALDAKLADDYLQLSQLRWTASDEELLSGTARLPVPKDFSKWREMIAEDRRPLELSIHSQALPLSRLSQWVPAMGQLDPISTGQLDLQASGTYAAPIVEAKIQAKDLRSPAQPKLPTAALQVSLIARDGQINADATATAPDFAPARITAAFPFRPAEWVNAPERIRSEPIEARLDLPRLDLSRFASLVPSAEKISGILTGNVQVSGEISKPDIKGSLTLNQGGLQLKNSKFPAVESGTAAVEFGLDRIVLKSLRASVAGGSINGEGSLSLAGAVPTLIDVRLRADHLPLMRNDFIILRANANLRLEGPFQRATLSGTIGTVDSLFYRDIELLPIGTPFTGPKAAAIPKIEPPKNEAAGLPEPFRNWLLNVQVRTEEPFLVRGNLANGQVTGQLRIGGTFANPAPDGTFDVRDFAADLPFSTLTVRRGTIRFTPEFGFDPILELRGSAEPRPYRVTVYAYGRASDPQLVLTSNPPLPENEIMTLLATGTTTSGLEDPQAASSRALQLLAEELRRGRFRYGKQFRPLLKLLDRVDFSLAEADPYSTDSYSTATVALTDRWFLSAGIGSTGDSRGMVIWRFSFR